MRFIAVCLAVLFAVPVCKAQTPKSNGWSDYGGTLAGQRYSTEKQIDQHTVSRLGVAWVFHTHALDKPSPSSNWRASFEATPVLWNNTLYFDTPFDQVFAIDAATGALRWTFDPEVDREAPIYIVTSRGVALWHAQHPRPGACGKDVVLVATVDRRLIARDAATGQGCPAFGNNGTVDLSQGVAIGVKTLYEFTSPPTVVGDTVVLGSTVGDNQTTFAASGAVRGFDVRTGRQAWSWEPLRSAGPHPPSTGSGNAWSLLSADPEHDLVFVPTGSASNDFYGGTRSGDNRDADSIVALQASTGRRVWAFQLVHHDIWDYDTPSQPVLFTFRHTIPAVAITTKTNMVYVFNRLTGEPLYPIVERPVAASTLPGEQAWPTQPFSTLPPLAPLSFTAADVHLNNPEDQRFCTDQLGKLENKGLFTPPSKQGSLVFPGSMGGSNWGSSAFDPSTSVLYTRISNLPFYVREAPAGPRGDSRTERFERKVLTHLPEWAGGDAPPLRTTMGTPDSGGEQRDESPQAGTPYRLARQALMSPHEVPCGPTPFGAIVAINLDTGTKLWSVPHGTMVPNEPGSIGDGGVIATAGGLLFAASTIDSLMRAYDSTTGAELWRGKLPAPSQATPMTYTVAGRQFVVIAAGGHGFIGKGQSDQVIAFALPRDAAAQPSAHAKKASSKLRH